MGLFDRGVLQQMAPPDEHMVLKSLKLFSGIASLEMLKDWNRVVGADASRYPLHFSF